MSTARGSPPRAGLGRVTGGPVLTGPPAMPPTLRKPMGVTAILAALVTAVLAFSYSDDFAAGWLDRQAQAMVGLLPLPDRQALVIDLVGMPLVAVTLASLLAVACIALRRRRLAVVAVTALGVTGGATTVLKPVIERTIHGGYLAYPSGHTAAATVLALVAALLAVDLLRAGRWSGLLIVFGAAGVAGATMAWTQVSLGAHYPTDTVGGFCTAVAVVTATALVIDWSVARHHNRTDGRAL